MISFVSVKMGPKGASLATAIASNKESRVKDMRLHLNQIGDEGVKNFACILAEQGKHLKIENIDISHNKITPTGLRYMVRLLEFPTLKVSAY